MNTIQQRIGKNLKYYRYQSGLSQEKFYSQFGLNAKYLASIERGEINVSVAFLDHLAKILEIDIREFFNPDETRNINKKRIDSKKNEELIHH